MGVLGKDIELYSGELSKEEGVVAEYADDILLEMSDSEGNKFKKSIEMMKDNLVCRSVDVVVFYAENEFDKSVEKVIHDQVLKSLIEDGKLFDAFVSELSKYLSNQKKQSF